MNNLVIVTAIFSVLSFLLVLFAIFAIGFLIGYKSEDAKIKRENINVGFREPQESEKEKKVKKEWRKFLEYDGSTPQEKI